MVSNTLNYTRETIEVDVATARLAPVGTLWKQHADRMGNITHVVIASAPPMSLTPSRWLR